MELTEELAEMIFEAGGDWRMTCKNFTDGIIGKVEWSEGVCFGELWDDLNDRNKYLTLFD